MTDRVLTPEEFQRIVTSLPDYLKSVLVCTYHTGMRRGEILRLIWLKEIDTKAVFRRNTIDKDALLAARRRMDTYMDARACLPQGERV